MLCPTGTSRFGPNRNSHAGARAPFKENDGYAQIEAHGDRKETVAAIMNELGWHQVGAHGFDVMFERSIN
jgi:hypothetical protein